MNERYIAADRTEKGRLLDEAVAMTGRNRKALIRAWRRSPSSVLRMNDTTPVVAMNNSRKDRLLGQPHGTAAARLRKSLLFKYVLMAGEAICFRCGRQIDKLDELSIEHKQSWQRAADPVDAFFDLANIAFSHLACNIRSAQRHVPQRQSHGLKAYGRGCRCDECRLAKSTANASSNAKRVRVL